MKKTQRQKIKEHLLKGRSLTQIQALNLFGCFRLASRIHDIRNEIADKKEPYLLHSDMITLKNGKRVAKYWIEKKRKSWHPCAR
jgi:Holliday junction resolvasome RuvABC ATP-dependent DNA helicase subunit